MKNKIMEVSTQLMYDEDNKMYSLEMFVHRSRYLPKNISGRFVTMSMTKEIMKHKTLDEDVLGFITENIVKFFKAYFKILKKE